METKVQFVCTCVSQSVLRAVARATKEFYSFTCLGQLKDFKNDFISNTGLVPLEFIPKENLEVSNFRNHFWSNITMARFQPLKYSRVWVVNHFTIFCYIGTQSSLWKALLICSSKYLQIFKLWTGSKFEFLTLLYYGRSRIFLLPENRLEQMHYI